MDTSANRLPVIVQFASKYLKTEIGIFAAKALIAAAVTLATLAIGANILIGAAIDQARTRIPTVRAGGGPFWMKVEDELERLAKGDGISPQKKQKIVADLRAISDKWRPFLLEVAAAVNGHEPPEQKK